MAAPPIPVHAAKTHLSRLIDRALAGEDVVIARGKHPVVRLVPVEPVVVSRQFGAMRGRLVIDDAFFDPLPEWELAAWEGER